MKPVFSRFLCAAFAVCAVFARAATNPPGSDHAPFTAKELRQGFREHVILAKPRAQHRATVDADEAREGVRRLHTFSRFGDLRVIELDDTDSAEQAIARLQATGRYEYVEPDFILHPSALPNDPQFGDLWGLRNTGQLRGTPGADIKAAEAWDIRHDAPGVVVAVIDTGVNLAHSDLVGNIWSNPNPTTGINDLHGARFTSGTGRITNGDPADDDGHGTHVAGTIGAVGNNGIGVAGVAWSVQIMALKFINASGSGSTDDSVGCIDYAIGHGANVINASFGADGGSPLSQSQRDAIARARDAGIIFVAAAGNETANMDVSKHYPASLPLDNIVTVGASTRSDDLAVFSNYGAAVDLFAPGYDIVSLDFANPNGGTSIKSGTSMATPHVVGALALLKAQFPSDTYRQLINRLLRGVDSGGKFSGQAQTGGRLNLLKALQTTSNRPFNDDFASRPRLSGDNLAIRSNNADATAEAGEPIHGGVAGGKSLWWEWTATGSTPVTITTAGSTYDTVLAVYTGNALGALTPVAANDDSGGVTSTVSFTLQAGTTYQIAVDGKNGATGMTILTLNAAPSNDYFATPVTLSGVSTHVTATNTLCTHEPGEPLILGNAGGPSLWYRWTAPKSGRFQVSVFTVDFDPLLAVYTGASLDALTLVTASDNSGFDGGQRPSLATFDAVAGTTYRFQVDGKALFAGGGNTGEFTVSIVDSTWQAATGRSGVTGDPVTGGPAVAPDGTIYFGSAGTSDHAVYAVNPDGALKWRFATTGGPNNAGGSIDTASAAVADDGTVYVGNSVGQFYALTPNGTQRWVHSFGQTNSASISPAIGSDGTVYVKIGDGRLYALDPQGGGTKWSVDIHGPLTYASPVIATDGTIYQGSEDHNLYAINPDGTVKWQYTTDSTGDVYSTPAIDAAGNIYFGVLNSGKFYSLTRAGALRWIYTGSFESISSSPAISADGTTVYFGSYDRRLHALDTATGTVRWTYQLANQVRASSPAIDANGVVYIGCYDDRIYAVNADGTLLRTYDTGGVVRSNPAIFGQRLYVGSSDRKVYAFDLAAGPAAGSWPQYRANVRRTGRAPTNVFTLTATPQSQVGVLGYPLTLTVAATGTAPLSYEWRKDGVAIGGATNATYSISSVSSSSAGAYTVVVRSPDGTITSPAATVTVESPRLGRLTNLSVRTNAGTGEQTLTVGFVVRGTNTKPLLVRGVGPTLANDPFNVPGVLADPQLKLVASATGAVVASNNDWGGGSSLASAFSSVGAFPLPADSRDAALVTSVNAADYTAQVTSANGTTGIALAELYDRDPLDAQTFVAISRLVNVSARAQVGTGGNILIAGFTISGNVPKAVLIRGIGPALGGAPFNVPGTLTNPKLEIYLGSTKVNENDDWGGTAALTTAFTQVGAFGIANPASRDAALLVTLSPGSYTVQLSGVNNTTGVGLIEIYEML